MEEELGEPRKDQAGTVAKNFVLERLYVGAVNDRVKFSRWIISSIYIYSNIQWSLSNMDP